MRLGTRQRTDSTQADPTALDAPIQPLEPPTVAQTTPPPPPAAPPVAQPEPPSKSIHQTRAARFWSSVVIGAVVLLALLIFVLENNNRVDVAYFGIHGQLPLGVLVLFGAIAGALFVGLAAAARIVQLRLAERRVRRTDRQQPISTQ